MCQYTEYTKNAQQIHRNTQNNLNRTIFSLSFYPLTSLATNFHIIYKTNMNLFLFAPIVHKKYSFQEEQCFYAPLPSKGVWPDCYEYKCIFLKADFLFSIRRISFYASITDSPAHTVPHVKSHCTACILLQKKDSTFQIRPNYYNSDNLFQ